MNFNDLATWLETMNALTGGCVLELRAKGGGLTLDLSWRHNGRLMAYGHTLTDVQVRHMHDTVQFSVLEQIWQNVARTMGK